MDKKNELKAIIKELENGKADAPLTLSRIYELTGKTVEERYLRSYWMGISLDDFCDELLTESIADWQQINDEKALLLIKEIFADVTNNGIVTRNMEALAKRYGKTAGFISDLIFHTNIQDESTILELLKKDSTIYL